MIWMIILSVLCLVQVAGMTWVLVKFHGDFGDSPIWWRLVMAFFWPIVALFKDYSGPQ